MSFINSVLEAISFSSPCLEISLSGPSCLHGMFYVTSVSEVTYFFVVFYTFIANIIHKICKQIKYDI